MTWTIIIKAIIGMCAICGYIYSLESLYKITKLKKEIEELKNKIK